MTPAASLGQALMVARRHGVDFADAWPPAVARAVAAAWEHRAASRAERALTAVATDPERVPMADRECQRCGAEIPADRDRRAKWCSEKCRRAASNERTAPVAVAA